VLLFTYIDIISDHTDQFITVPYGGQETYICSSTRRLLSHWRCLPRSVRAGCFARLKVTTEMTFAVRLNPLAKLIVSFGG
jgi:hypothetical protein